MDLVVSEKTHFRKILAPPASLLVLTLIPHSTPSSANILLVIESRELTAMKIISYE